MNGVSVDIHHPMVRKMLDAEHPLSPHAGRRRGVVQLAGDESTGLSCAHDLSAGKHEVAVVYRDQILTVDVYLIEGEAPTAHIVCPRCHKTSRIDGRAKKIDYDPRAVNPMGGVVLAAKVPELAVIADFGRLSIEPFECPWEIGNDPHVRGALHTGASLCRLRIGITDNRALDA